MTKILKKKKKPTRDYTRGKIITKNLIDYII